MIRFEWLQDGLNQIGVDALDALDNVGELIVQEADAPVDTGFLGASAYVFSDRVNTFDNVWANGLYTSGHTGREVDRQATYSPIPHVENGVTVGWAAIYAWWVEDATPFIYPALLEVAKVMADD